MGAWRRFQFSEVIVGLGVLAAAVFTVVLIVWLNINRMESADASDREARTTLTQLDAVDKALLNQEAGLRAYVVVANPQFLTDFLDGRASLSRALTKLTPLTADDPLERDRLKTLSSLSRKWDASVAVPEIALVQAGNPASARAMVQGQSGERQMVVLHRLLDRIRQSEQDTLAVRARSQAQSFATARLTLVLGSLGALVMAALLSGRSLLLLVKSRDAAEAASRAKTQFLANMSHKIRTPLNGMSGVADALARSKLDLDQLALVDTVRRSAEAVDSLIGDLLTLSRDLSDDALHLVTFELGAFVREAVANVRGPAEAKGLTLVVETGPNSDAWVEADAGRLHQIMDRLLANAVKFTEQGTITLTLAALRGDRYRFEVSDTGAGFDDSEKDRLFDPFVQADDTATRRHGGAGLGLAIAKRAAQAIGARLDCASTPGEGSRFTVDLDLPATGAPPAQSRSEQAPVHSIAEIGDGPDDETPFRILIVDDHPTNRQVLELILDHVGVDHVSVEDGQQAVDAAERQVFSAILMDIQMPVMDGLTATRKIREAERASGRPDTPVIIVSANCQPESVAEGKAAGAQRHLSKPVNAEALIAALDEVLDEERHAA